MKDECHSLSETQLMSEDLASKCEEELKATRTATCSMSQMSEALKAGSYDEAIEAMDMAVKLVLNEEMMEVMIRQKELSIQKKTPFGEG